MQHPLLEPALIVPAPISRPADGLEWAIVDLLLERRQLWSIEELVDALGNPAAIAEAIETLHAAQLIERVDAFVRIAVRPTP